MNVENHSREITRKGSEAVPHGSKSLLPVTGLGLVSLIVKTKLTGDTTSVKKLN